jgi:hypothetical protein
MVCLLLATGIAYGYGYFTGPNCCTPTRTRGKTRAKPAGIPVPVKDTRWAERLAGYSIVYRNHGIDGVAETSVNIQWMIEYLSLMSHIVQNCRNVHIGRDFTQYLMGGRKG